jgi:hypothetical protein
VQLLLIPVAILLIVGLLAATDFAETRVLAPRSMILYGVRSKRVRPEQAEQLIAAQAQTLLARSSVGDRATR